MTRFGAGKTTLETWLPVAEFDGAFEVSNLGRVRSISRLIWNGNSYIRISGRVLRPSHLADGYPRMALSLNGKKHMRLVHRLVAETFHADKRNALHREVDHIDHDRANNRADNLQWVSHAHNLARRSGRKTHSGKISGEQMREILALQGTGSAKEIARQYGLDQSTVYAIWKRRPWVIKRLSNTETAGNLLPPLRGSAAYGVFVPAWHQG